ncbi:MAG: Rpn family recombination-promoting nuclease/putative transposase [Oscillospiraceae bacterium]|nr:Rpn family recombination-promoting nuclease/putative transposase [Oscillospiraceae bacterium]
MDIKSKPKLDIVFKKLFTDVHNMDLLIDFLSCVIEVAKEEIYDVTIIDNEVIPDSVDKKFSRLDVLLRSSQGTMNIEIQVNNYGNFKERSLYYWAKAFSGQLNKGEDYSTLQKTVSINIIDFNLFNCEEPHSVFLVSEKDRAEMLTDKFRIDFLELKKAGNSKNPMLKEWLKFLSVTTEEELDDMNTTTINPEIIGKAIAVIRKMSADEKLLYEIQQREKAILDERSALNYAEKKVKIEGVDNLITQFNFTLEDALKAMNLTESEYNSLKNI